MYQISKNCVACHNCAMECPMGAIQYVGIKYEIDPEKCVECGLCETLCHTSSISDVDHPVAPTHHDPVERHCDLVVCGGGTGLITAIKAAQLGKKVILLEKAKKLGGNTDYAHAFFPVYSQWHKEKGMPDLREDAVAHYRNVTDNVLEEEVLHTAVYDCSNFFDWLCTFPGTNQAFEIVNLGDNIAHGPIYGPGLISFPHRLYDNLLCRDQAIGPGWGGTFIKYAMLDAIKAQKLDVEILTATAARHLLTDDSGRVTGVVAEDDGGTVTIHAQAVVLATGGFGRCDEKLEKYIDFFNCETPIHRFSVPTDTGDGIDMLRELGVEPDPTRMFASIFGPAHHPFNYCILRMAQEPNTVAVNLNGKRWVDESIGLHGMTASIAKQPKEISYTILNQEMIDQIAKGYITDPAGRHEAWIYKTYQADLEEEISLGMPVKRGDTLAELAEQMGVDPATLEGEMARYNLFCTQGEDGDFGKAAKFLTPITQGPYYAIYGQRFSEGAFGGLRVNGKCQVTRADGTPIGGLYGVGDATSAMHRSGKLAVISELTWAVASAYRSAISAVETMCTQEEG